MLDQLATKGDAFARLAGHRVPEDLQSVERFRQQNREVVGALIPGRGTGVLVDRWNQGRSPPGFITCLARLLNASGEKDSKN